MRSKIVQKIMDETPEEVKAFVDAYAEALVNGFETNNPLLKNKIVIHQKKNHQPEYGC